jgi:hypothetical protein
MSGVDQQAPIRFVEMIDRSWTDAVYLGDPPATKLLGFVRYDPQSDRYVARTRGCPDGSKPADIRRKIASREQAAEWLAGATNGVHPRVMHRRSAP